MMHQAEIKLMTKEGSEIETFFMSVNQLHFAYDYLEMKGARYDSNYMQSLFINVEELKKAMFIDSLQNTTDDESLITALKIPGNEEIIKNIIKAVEPLGNATYLFRFTIY